MVEITTAVYVIIYWVFIYYNLEKNINYRKNNEKK